MLRCKPAQSDYPYEQGFGHKRDGYTSKQIESLLEGVGFKVEKREYAYKGVVNSLDNFFWETRWYRIVTVLLYTCLMAG